MNKGYILIIVGGFAILYGLYCLYRFLALKKWLTTQGVIISSAKSIRRVNFQKMEDPEITFEYTVGGKVYRSSSVRASGQHSSTPSKKGSSETDKLLEKYPEGSEVTVYYNPKLPRMACLEQGGGEAMLICLIFGPIALAVGYFYFLR